MRPQDEGRLGTALQAGSEEGRKEPVPGWAACATPVSQAGGGTWQAHSRAGRDVCRLRATASQLKPHQLNRRSEQPVGQAETQRCLPSSPAKWPGLGALYALPLATCGDSGPWESSGGGPSAPLTGVPVLPVPPGDCQAGRGSPSSPGKEFGQTVLGLCVCHTEWWVGAHCPPVSHGVEGLRASVSLSV